jgi:hypothetical protein
MPSLTNAGWIVLKSHAMIVFARRAMAFGPVWLILSFGATK